ncbi:MULTISPECIES: LPS export ABC transporter periplasmic protein LptC [Pseudothermotoga]|nr:MULTISPECIES: LPS export ABC transporter periplasmic protein LptC [Pseudothermotoga]MBC7123304.1 LPS export ABC transporter periplasmic protein LptC [Pseudothermotoga sp.]MDI6862077.1 LPS export ABC transporter periplasmic protein LptC [Pseudothermotoga sp.]
MKKNLLIVLLLCLFITSFAKTVHIVSNYVKPEKDRAYYEGNVKVRVEEDKLTLLCQSMLVTKLQNEWRLIDATSTFIEFESGQATATNLKYDLKTKTGTLMGNVQAKITDEESSDEVQLFAEKLSIDLDGNVFQTDKPVRVIKGNIEASANGLFYNRKLGLIKLTGSVVLVDHEKNLKMWADAVEIKTANDEMTATNAKVELVVEE